MQNCSTWGQPGTFRLFLRTNLSHASVVARSPPITVVVNPDYDIASADSQFVLPCLKNDIKPFSVRRPACAALNDKIRVYGQGECAHARARSLVQDSKYSVQIKGLNIPHT